MWERIKRLWSKEEAPPPALTLPEAEQQEQLDFLRQELQAGRLNGLDAQLRPFLGSIYPPIAQLAQRSLALTFFHQGNYAQASTLFEKLAKETQTTNDWFNTVSSATLAGDIKRGADAFERALNCRSDTATNAPSLADLHFFYACALRDAKEYEQAFAQIQALRGLYEKHLSPIASVRHQDAHKIPALPDALEVMTDILSEASDRTEAKAWLQEFATRVNAQAQMQIRQALVRLESTAKTQPGKAETASTVEPES